MERRGEPAGKPRDPKGIELILIPDGVKGSWGSGLDRGGEAFRTRLPSGGLNVQVERWPSTEKGEGGGDATHKTAKGKKIDRKVAVLIGGGQE